MIFVVVARFLACFHLTRCVFLAVHLRSYKTPTQAARQLHQWEGRQEWEDSGNPYSTLPQTVHRSWLFLFLGLHKPRVYAIWTANEFLSCIGQLKKYKKTFHMCWKERSPPPPPPSLFNIRDLSFITTRRHGTINFYNCAYQHRNIWNVVFKKILTRILL